jgi:hypothetical protein
MIDTIHRKALLSDGSIVEYHWITDSPDDHKSGWTDAEYVGTGEVYSIDGVLQHVQSSQAANQGTEVS